MQLGKAAAAALVGDNWVPVCRPEDLPKGECEAASCCCLLLHVSFTTISPKQLHCQSSWLEETACEVAASSSGADSARVWLWFDLQACARSLMWRAGKC